MRTVTIPCLIPSLSPSIRPKQLPLSVPAESHPRIPAAPAMSDRHLRRRIPSTRPKSRPPHPTRSSNARTLSSHRRSRPHKAAKILQRCSSEPILWTVGLSDAADDLSHHHPHRQQLKQQVLLFRPQTCTDVFSSASPLLSPSPSSYSLRTYSDDSKVVVSVTVEGSPGPVRTMVRLGATVQETIKLVVDKYTEEGRSPRLSMDASSTFELHHSYFSLESLDKTEKMGEMGSRNFFLRRRGSSRSNSSSIEEDAHGTRNSSHPAPVPPQLFFSFIARRISKLGRRTRKIWKILGCIACG